MKLSHLALTVFIITSASYAQTPSTQSKVSIECTVTGQAPCSREFDPNVLINAQNGYSLKNDEHCQLGAYDFKMNVSKSSLTDEYGSVKIVVTKMKRGWFGLGKLKEKTIDSEAISFGPGLSETSGFSKSSNGDGYDCHVVSSTTTTNPVNVLNK